MDENKKEEQTPINTGEGNESKIPKVIEQANSAAKRIEEANKKQEELIERQEELLAKQTLGGSAEGGIEEKKPKSMTDKEYAETAIKGDLNKKQEDDQ